jgi:predicted amidohydrolase
MRVFGMIGVCLLAVGVGCSDSAKPQPDVKVDVSVVPDKGPQKESGAKEIKVDVPPTPTSLKVAAIQFTNDDYTKVAGCASTPGTCAIEKLIKDAAAQQATFVVTPDYATYAGVPTPATKAEAEPAVGDSPATDSKWAAGSVLKTLASLAASQKIWIVFFVATKSGDEPPVTHHTTVAVDPGGVVRGLHHKLQLFGPEATNYTPGSSLATSFFQSPAGKMGLLASADAQCIVLDGVANGTECTTAAAQLITSYKAVKPDAVSFVALWFGGADPKWQAPNVMAKIASWIGAWVVVGNGTVTPNGNAGGIWKPDGTPLKTENPTAPTIIIAEIPLKP